MKASDTIYSILITLIFVVGISFPQPVGAIVTFESNPLNWISNNLLQVKEFALDGIAWGVINLILEEIINDTTAWVQSGFEGEPAFLEDPQMFLRDVGDIAAGQVLNRLTDMDGDGSGWLCRPIDYQVRFLLYLYAFGDDSERSCRLSNIVDNVEDFYNNDLRSGGIFALQRVYINNPYAQLFELQNKIDAAKENAVNEQRTELTWSQGFLNRKRCYQAGEIRPNSNPDIGFDVVVEDETGQNCTGPIETPGITIERTLQNSLGIQTDRLTVADEIDELIGALLGQLANRVVGGVGGLLGGRSGGGGGGGFTPSAPIPNDPVTLLANRGTDLINAIDQYIELLQTTERLASGVSQTATDAVTACTADGNVALAAQAATLNTEAVEVVDEMSAIIQSLTVQRVEVTSIYQEAEAAEVGNTLSAQTYNALDERMGGIEDSISEYQRTLTSRITALTGDMSEVQSQVSRILETCQE